MKNITLSLILLFAFIKINASEKTLHFQEANKQEIHEIQEQLVNFYGEALFTAGLFEDLGTAQQAATTECQNMNEKYSHYFRVKKKLLNISEKKKFSKAT